MTHRNYSIPMAWDHLRFLQTQEKGATSEDFTSSQGKRLILEKEHTVLPRVFLSHKECPSTVLYVNINA